MNRIQSNNHKIVSHRINKIYLFSYDEKNIYLKMDLVDNQIFINLVVNYCRTETSYFNFRSIQNSYFFSLFPSYKKLLFFFVQ